MEEALTLAAPRPLTPKQHGQILTSRAEQIAVVTDRLQIEAGSTIGNAALLAHFYNHGPELVDALKKAVVELDAMIHDQYDGTSSLSIRLRDLDEIKALLAKASTVQMP